MKIQVIWAPAKHKFCAHHLQDLQPNYKSHQSMKLEITVSSKKVGSFDIIEEEIHQKYKPAYSKINEEQI